MRRVLRWEVTVDDRPHEIGGGPVLWVANRPIPGTPVSGRIEVWTEEDEPGRPRRLAIAVGTGQPIPEDAREHLGSVFDAAGALVWHLYEVAAWPQARGLRSVVPIRTYVEETPAP